MRGVWARCAPPAPYSLPLTCRCLRRGLEPAVGLHSLVDFARLAAGVLLDGRYGSGASAPGVRPHAALRVPAHCRLLAGGGLPCPPIVIMPHFLDPRSGGGQLHYYVEQRVTERLDSQLGP